MLYPPTKVLDRLQQLEQLSQSAQVQDRIPAHVERLIQKISELKLPEMTPQFEQVVNRIPEVYPSISSTTIKNSTKKLPNMLKELSQHNPQACDKASEVLESVFETVSPQEIENTNELASPETVQAVSENLKDLGEALLTETKENNLLLRQILECLGDIKKPTRFNLLQFAVTAISAFFTIVKRN